MFCMSCGAEAGFGAPTCSVCGASLGGTPEPQAERRLPDHPSRRESLAIAVTVPSQPSVGYGDLETLGLPREPAERALLGGLCLLVLTLFLPWASVAGVGVSPFGLGMPAVLLIVIVAVAALPVLRPSFRRYAALAHAPVAVGAFFVGTGVCVWAVAGLFAASGSQLAIWVSSAPLLGPGDTLSTRGPQALFTPGSGMYVAIVAGCIVLFAATTAHTPAAPHSAGGLSSPETRLPSPSREEGTERVTAEAQPSGDRHVNARQPVISVPSPSAHGTTHASTSPVMPTPSSQASATPLERGELPRHRQPQTRIR